MSEGFIWVSTLGYGWLAVAWLVVSTLAALWLGRLLRRADVAAGVNANRDLEDEQQLAYLEEVAAERWRRDVTSRSAWACR